MSLDVINPIQNTSYTNRDFESVYSELLDLVKKLTYKWDPSISNESDPGVILLKLNAIIADKLSYNLDKNILECFPLSVTQEGNARQLFEQLGYYMKWYRGATVDVALKWKSTFGDASYTIPAFTMVSDMDSTTVYSLIGPSISSSSSLSVSNQYLSTDGSILLMRAIQGIPVKYDINGDTLIRFSALDSNRRIYFNSSDIAQNGIFITNKDQNNYSSWQKVDNLTVQSISSSNRYFKFGVTTDGTTCYLEFPDNAESIFGEGIEITYIRTLGENGNISARVLEKFYQDLVPAEDTSIILNSDNVLIANISSASNGANPETINEAYRNYKRTIGTFDTLVTLRDYFNYIVSAEGLVSNAVVADRTNDIQSTYKIVSNKNLVQNVITQVETSESDEPLLTAYSLKLYLLKYQPVINSEDTYNRTFEMMNNYEKITAEGYTQNSKSIQHDYENLVSGKIAYILNKYPISCNITTQNALSEAEASEVTSNIKLAIYRQLNSQQVDFGEEVPIDLIKNVILSADKRIKDVTFNTTEYDTYAVIYNETESQSVNGTGTFESICISGPDYVSSSSTANTLRQEIFTKSVLSGNTQLYVENESLIQIPVQAQQGFYTYSINAPVKEISAHLDIPVSISNGYTAWSYTLRKNEVIQMYAPNLLNVAEYSNFVRYEYVGPSIEANTSYRLTSNECIVFYWQDSTSTVYNYITYAEGCIIKPNFSLSAKSLSDNAVLASYRSTIWPTVNDSNYVIQGSGYVRSSSNFGNITEDISNAISSLSRNSALSGSKKIVVQSANKITLSNDDGMLYYCYWSLNSTTDNKYVLFDGSEAEQEYILDTGEYFFYTDANMSQLNILGAGTTIVKNTTGTPRVWQVPVKDTSSIMNNGISAFNTDDWFRLLSSESCELSENQYYIFYEGTTIKLNHAVPGGSFPYTAVISSDPIDLRVQDISYILPDSTGEVFLPSFFEGTDVDWWKARSSLNITLDKTNEVILLGPCIPDDPDHEQSEVGNGQYIAITDTSDYSGTVFGYNAHTESRTDTYGEDICDYTAEGLSILSDRSIILNNNISLDFSNTSAPWVMSFALIKDIVDSETGITRAHVLDEGAVQIHFEALSTYGVNIYVPVQNPAPTTVNRILSIYVPPNVSITTLNIKDENNSSLLDISGESNLNTSGMHYIKLSDQNQQLNIISTGHTESYDVIVYNPYYWEIPSNLTSSQFNNIEQTLRNLDIDNMYDYTYQVDEDTLIEDPLDPESFFKLNHPYNSYTISQFDIDKSTIKILGKRK